MVSWVKLPNTMYRLFLRAGYDAGSFRAFRPDRKSAILRLFDVVMLIG
jgi:hypothetical protein